MPSLYGRALYTSSVLIGIYWIGIILMLLVCYQLLYTIKARSAAGKSWWGFGIVAFLFAGGIAKIYSTNMTLMLHPELWHDLYQSNQSGIVLPSAHLEWMPRWTYMMVSGITAAGILLAWLSSSSVFTEAARKFLARLGGQLALGGAGVSLGVGLWVWAAQPETIRNACSANSFWLPFVGLWTVGAIGVIVLCGYLLLTRPQLHWPVLAGLSVVAFVQIAGAVLCRDIVRDAFLAQGRFQRLGPGSSRQLVCADPFLRPVRGGAGSCRLAGIGRLAKLSENGDWLRAFEVPVPVFG